MHDQRPRPAIRSRRTVKVSSPTLRKLCLPCISARNRRHHHHQQRSTRSKPLVNNQHEIVSTSAVQDNIADRRRDVSSKRPALVQVNEKRRESEAAQSSAQHLDSSFPTPLREKKDDQVSLKTEATPTKKVLESVLLSLLSSANERTRSNAEELVGTYVDTLSINFRGKITMILLFIFVSPFLFCSRLLLLRLLRLLLWFLLFLISYD